MVTDKLPHNADFDTSILPLHSDSDTATRDPAVDNTSLCTQLKSLVVSLRQNYSHQQDNTISTTANKPVSRQGGLGRPRTIIPRTDSVDSDSSMTNSHHTAETYQVISEF